MNKTTQKNALDALNLQFDAARQAIQKVCLSLPHEQRTEAWNAIYAGPAHLSQWSPKHSAAIRQELPQLERVVWGIENLVADRKRLIDPKS